MSFASPFPPMPSGEQTAPAFPSSPASGAAQPLGPGTMIPPPVSARTERSGRAGAAFGGRFFLFLLIGLVWLGPAWWDARFLAGMFLWDLLAVVFWAVDLRRLPDRGDMFVARIWSAPAALSVSTQVAIEVTQGRRSAVRVELADTVPPALRAVPPAFVLWCQPGVPARQTYDVAPVARGDLRLGGVHLRVQSRLGFAERWLAARLEQTVRVYPNLEEARRHTFYLLRSRQSEMEKRRVRLRGYGREFESLREYHQGDELRDICWTASARRGSLVTRLHTIERSQAVWIVMDAGRLLRARVMLAGQPAALEKLDFAATAALTLSYIVLYSGDRIGLLAYGRQLQQRVNPARGPRHQRALADALALVRSEPYEADHLLACETLLRAQKRRSLIVWITDLPETAAMPEVMEGAIRLMRRHLVLFVVLAQPDVARVGAASPVSPGEMYRSMAAQELIQRRDVAMRTLHTQGALTVQVDSQNLAPALLGKYLEIKERSLV